MRRSRPRPRGCSLAASTPGSAAHWPERRSRREGTLSVRALDQRLQNVAGKGQTLAYRLWMTVANVVVGQMLPLGVVKGGTAMKIRLGESGGRFTPDLDTARRESLTQFVEAFEDFLASGWHGFTGRLVERAASKPVGVPTPYVMRPYEVKLAFHGRSWHTVKVELGHDEIGDADDPVCLLADDIRRLFAEVGLSRPDPIGVMPTDHPDRPEAARLHPVPAMSARMTSSISNFSSRPKSWTWRGFARPPFGSSATGETRLGRRRWSPARRGPASTTRRQSVSTCCPTSPRLSAGPTI